MRDSESIAMLKPDCPMCGPAYCAGRDMIDPTTAIMDWEQADQIMQDQRAEIARLRLTDAEREAIMRAMYRVPGADSETMWQLLERTK